MVEVIAPFRPGRYLLDDSCLREKLEQKQRQKNERQKNGGGIIKVMLTVEQRADCNGFAPNGFAFIRHGKSQ